VGENFEFSENEWNVSTNQKTGIRLLNLHSLGSVPSNEAHEVWHLSLHVSLWSLAYAMFWPQHTFADQLLFSAL